MQADKKRNETGRDTKGRFANGNRLSKGRPVGATCHALRMARDAAVDVALPMLIDAAKAGDMDAAKALIAYGLPKQRPVELPEPLSLPRDADYSRQMAAIMDAVAAGEIAPSVGGELASIVATAAKVDEVTELRQRLDALAEKIEREK